MAYKIKYLRSFKNDLNSAVRYIANDLGNPTAAAVLLTETEKEISRLAGYPFPLRPFACSKRSNTPYYRTIVKNYYIFFTIDGNTLEMRYFVHTRRNYIEII
jgi:plasmid stabilization system protein ParE